MRRYLLSLAAAIVCSASVWAVIASPEPVEITQADGTKVQVRMMGDEFHHYYTLLDGTPVRRTEEGMFVKDASVAQMPTSARRARQATEQAQVNGSYPLTGSPTSLVILVNFSDLAFQYKLEDFQQMLNESGYSKNNGVGSARDYFIASSDSVFSPIFDCYGPVTVSKGYAYYGGNSGSSSSVHASQMVVEACNLVSDMGVDLTQYDTDNDGRLDNVFIYYAGHNEAEHGGENTIWPHRSIVGGNERVQGKLIYDYACTSELRGAAGNSMCGIGTFCHEFGHVLGLPDYYNTANSSAYTVGEWDIMCSGSYNGNGKTPPSYTAGERFQLGWLTPVQLNDAGIYTLEPLETSNKAYLIAKSAHNLSWGNASPNEYWLLENRQNVGWDAPSTALPGTGMLIFHINYSATAWTSNTPNNGSPLRYDIEEAGGSKAYSSPADPFPGTKKVTTFTPVLHNGDIVEQPLLDITKEGQNISFIFKSAGGGNFMMLPTEIPVLASTYNTETKTATTPSSTLKIVGEHLEPGTLVVSASGSGFQVSLNDKNWSTSYDLTVGADSTIEKFIYVRYAPQKQVCDVQQGRISFRLNGATVGVYTVSGTSPRPLLIGAPQISTVEEITPTTFKFHWEPELDAEEYYVTLYHLEDGEESTMESFEGFDDELVVAESGWATSFYRTDRTSKDDGQVSMWFKSDGEEMVSPIYALPVINVSMWLNAQATSIMEVGWIILKGISETKGEVVLDTINITKNTMKYRYKLPLKEEDGFRRFILKYAAFGSEGVCLDAFTTTFPQKTVYTYKGRERTIYARPDDTEGQYTLCYVHDLIPNTAYFVQLQCSENKGCKENLSSLSTPALVWTKKGEPANSNKLTLDLDSIAYDPATHVVYLPQSNEAGCVNIYSSKGELVASIPVKATQNVVPLPDGQLRRGSVYLVKYLPEYKLSRKGAWIKILYR